MPTYEYRCAKCGEDLEVYQSFSDAPLTKHQSCGGKLTKVLSPAGIVLKGSGFYKTDNRSSSTKRSAASDSKNGDAKSSSTSELLELLGLGNPRGRPGPRTRRARPVPRRRPTPRSA